MLTDTELDELARAVAGLGDEDAGRLDEAVRERRRAKAEAQEARIAALRAMDDHRVIDVLVEDSVTYPREWDTTVALQVLRDAGFVRGDGLKALYRTGWNDALRRYPDDGEAEFQQARDHAIERLLFRERV